MKQYDKAVRLVVSGHTTCVVLPVHLIFIKDLNAFHHIIHFETIEFQKSYQQISHQQFLAFFLQLVLLLDVSHNHQDESVAADSSQIRRTKVGDIDKFLEYEDKRLELRVFIYLDINLLRYFLIRFTDCRPL